MINERLVKAIVLVTVMQSLLLVGIEIASHYRDNRYVKIAEQSRILQSKLEELEMFSLYDSDFEEHTSVGDATSVDNLLDFSNVPNHNYEHTAIEELNSKNVVMLADSRVDDSRVEDTSVGHINVGHTSMGENHAYVAKA